MSALGKRSAASVKGWRSRRAMQAARAQMDRFMADGTPIDDGRYGPDGPVIGTNPVAQRPADILARIRAREQEG